MSFRLRVFLLVLLVAATAIGGTAWLTLSLVSRQIDAAADDASRDSTATADELKRFARDRGTWAGVWTPVKRLSESSRQRIRLVTLYGEVVVDSDHLLNRAARPVVSRPTLIDPRPQFRPPDTVGPTGARGAPVPSAVSSPASKYDRKVIDVLHASVVAAISDYRYSVRLTSCLWSRDSARGQTIRLVDAGNGVPMPADVAGLEGNPCLNEARSTQDMDRHLYEHAVGRCPKDNTAEMLTCLSRAFTEQISAFAPPPLQLYLGAAEDDPAELLGTPVLVAAGAIMLLAVVGTALVARRVSHPIRSLTVASRRLAEGHLDTRVSVKGADEVGELSRSFNRMAEALQQAEDDQRRLIADVAHELRTPLSNLRGYLEALQDGVVTPSREVFTSLSEEVVLQSRILDDLQYLTLAETGGLTYRQVRTDVTELVEIGRVAHMAVAESAGVALTAAATGPLWVEADHDRIRQVLGNLIANAIRHTDAGGMVSLHAYALEELAIVEVRDTGCGIAPDDLPYVFHRFWRADRARRRATGGSGLGLTIARRIALDHGGDIDVESTLGAGSVFTLSLPLAADGPPSDTDRYPAVR